jgi:prepilin-type N-terminal cleavage/methylation domain-containing protein
MSSRRRGFTLLELLLATALAAVLMMGIWSLLSMYNRLFTKGQGKAEQAQLVRALLQQLTDDLHAAIQDPVPGQPTRTRGPVPVRRFVLVGSQTELQFDVLQITPFGGSLTPTAESEYAPAKAPLRSPELRTVYYRFGSAAELPDGQAAAQPGLSRRELDFETPYEEDGAGAGAAISPSGLALDDSAADLVVVDPNDDSVMLAPEVVDCRFRYFDGSAWTSQWNSLSRKSLPVAVEVTIQVATLEDRQQEVRQDLSGPVDAEELLTGGKQAPLQKVNPTYRLVIDIPGAPMHEEPRKVRKTAVSRLRERAATRYQPRLVPRDRSQQTSLADQQMRVER